jgi:hypothetical protein
VGCCPPPRPEPDPCGYTVGHGAGRPGHGHHPVGPGRMPSRSRGWPSLRCIVAGRAGASGRAEGRRTPYGQRPGVTCPRRSALGRAHALRRPGGRGRTASNSSVRRTLPLTEVQDKVAAMVAVPPASSG